MALTVTKKDPAAVALGRKGGKKGGPARAAALTPEQRSASARKAVQARWAKSKKGRDRKEAAPAAPSFDTSKKALHLCLRRITTSEEHTSELQAPCNLVCRPLVAPPPT